MISILGLEGLLARVLTRSRCVTCGDLADGIVCATCHEHLPWLDSRAAPRTAIAVAAAWRFEEPVASAVRRLKYEDRPDLATPLVRLAAPALEMVPGGTPDLLVPVPLHPRRLASRGFNQSALLARAWVQELAALRCRVRVAPRALWRRVDTGQLVGKGRDERRRTVHGAFAVRHTGVVAGRKVLLVDDVFTTGATVEACAHALRSVGAEVTGALVLCRTTGAG